MYGSVKKSEENMNETKIELLASEQQKSPEENKNYDLSIFRRKFTTNDWTEVYKRYKAKLTVAKQHKTKVWRVQEVVEPQHQTDDREGQDAQPSDGNLIEVGGEKLWKIREEPDNDGASGKNIVAGTERLWTKCLYEVQAKKIKESCEEINEDPIFAMIKIWFKETKRIPENNDLLPSLEHQISKLANIIFEEQCTENKCEIPFHKCKYGNEDTMRIKDGCTIMHLVAEENMAMLASTMIFRFPRLLNQGKARTFDKNRRLPVELALDKQNNSDNVAAIMIKNMNSERVRKLFQPDQMTGKTRLRFDDCIKNKTMRKSVIAILDCLMKPDWPFIDEEEESDNGGNQSGAWSKIDDVPIRYHINFRILDGDPEGRAPGEDGFDQKADSNFKALLSSPNREIIIQHPAVRLLADCKWKDFGKVWVRTFAVAYFVFLITLSIALLSATAVKDPRLYNNSMDYFRMLCEIITLFATFIYLILEVDQMISERFQYLCDKYNHLDIAGILLLFVLVPLRFYSISAQWGVASAAFLVNFLRIFKYAPAWPEMGSYARCLSQMLFKDGRQFAVVYLVVMFSFAGSIFLALKGTNELSSVGGFGDIIIREIRILVGGQSFAENYSSFNVVIVILILVNMLVVLIMLVNMLIAQLSTAYENAQKNGEIQFSIDQAWMTTKLESSHFKNFRKEFYKEGVFEADMVKLRSYLDAWNRLKAEKNIGNLPNEAEKQAIRNLAGKDQYYGVIL